MKILHLVPPTFGGIDAYVFNHYRYMDWKKFQFDFMTLNPGLKNAPKYQDFPYNVRQLPATAAENREEFIQAVQSILLAKYDVLHLHTSHWTGTLIEEIARESHIPKVIVHAHTTYIEEADEEKRQFLLRQHEEIKAHFSPDLATDFWACSAKAGDWLFGPQIPREKIRIIKNAIETERYQYSEEKRKSVRMKLGIENFLVLGAVGRLEFSKNYMFLIRFFAEFYKKHKNAKLLIVGDGRLQGEIEAKIREEHLETAVFLLGWKTNVADYLQAMDCFLLPSRFEGLGMAALEACAAGLPCLVSDQLPEEIEISCRIQRIPLECSKWMAAMEQVAEEEPFDRRQGVEIVRTAGYDVRQQAKVLESMYRS